MQINCNSQSFGTDSGRLDGAAPSQPDRRRRTLWRAGSRVIAGRQPPSWRADWRAKSTQPPSNRKQHRATRHHMSSSVQNYGKNCVLRPKVVFRPMNPGVDSYLKNSMSYTLTAGRSTRQRWKLFRFRDSVERIGQRRRCSKQHASAAPEFSYSFGIRSVLLIIRLPDNANSSENG
jgi:hypothetical protein